MGRFHYQQCWTTSHITKNSIRDRYKPISKNTKTLDPLLYSKGPRVSNCVFRNGLISISDWVFGNVWSCSTLFIMKTSHKSDELNNLKKGGVHKSGTYVMGPRGANRNYTYSKITHINSQEGKSWWLIEHDIQACYKYIKYIIKKTHRYHHLIKKVTCPRHETKMFNWR